MKKAFTMIELVFVIVVIGILAAVIIPNTRTNPLYEAATQLVSHIRYAQHLGMVDDKFDSGNANWHRNRWQIRFNGNQYTIASENNTVFAKNPMNVDANLSNTDLMAKYSTTVALSDSCLGQSILSFDHLGRPIVGDLSANTTAYTSQLINTACTITLSSNGENVSIKVEPETGYAHIIN